MRGFPEGKPRDPKETENVENTAPFHQRVPRCCRPFIFASQPRPKFEDVFLQAPRLDEGLRKNSLLHTTSPTLSRKTPSGGKASLHKPVGNEKGGMPIRPWASGTCASVRKVCNGKSRAINKNLYSRVYFFVCGDPASWQKGRHFLCTPVCPVPSDVPEVPVFRSSGCAFEEDGGFGEKFARAGLERFESDMNVREKNDVLLQSERAWSKLPTIKTSLKGLS